MRTSKIILAAIVSLALQPCLAQPPIGCDPPSTRARIIINDNGSGIDTLWFGFDISARYMIDPPLCEWEIPPAPPTGVFDARFVNTPGREGWDAGQGLGQGTKQDYRPYEGRADIDTHKIRFSPGDAGYPVTLRWSVDRIIAICDSAVIGDEFGGIIVRARMDQVDSVRVMNPVISYLLLIRYGAILHPVSVTTDDRPTTFALHQNYPNPFNPKTTIIYEVKSRESVSLRVVDVLGRQVATLVNEVREPGMHETEWDAGDLASGLYFYQLKAGEFTSTKKLLLLR